MAHLFASLQDRACEIIEDLEANKMVRKMKKRICLVLDCLCAHDFSDKTADLINLQHYVIKEKRLSERETVVIFYDVVRVVEALHKVRPLLALSLLEGWVFPRQDNRPLRASLCGQRQGAGDGHFSCFPVAVLYVRPPAPRYERAFPPLEFLEGNVVFVDCGEGPAGRNADQVNRSVTELRKGSQGQEWRPVKHREHFRLSPCEAK